MTEQSPYPGLRAFRRDETDLFYGRKANVHEVIDRLATTRFVAVLGSSGSGKSSLVRTGVTEALELGLLREAGASWEVIDFKPGDNALVNLATALVKAKSGEADPAEVEALTASLRRGPGSVVEWCRDGNLEAGTNLFLLVDQFEELFRYDSYDPNRVYDSSERAQAFVNLLIGSASQHEVPIYVVLTMRSEYLGACALLDGLAEAINRGQYLTPRMRRSDFREAILLPAKVSDVVVDNDLVNRLLNDVAAFAPWDDSSAQTARDVGESTAGMDQIEKLGRRADQLPLMQHVLNRLRVRSRDRGDKPIRLTLKDYLAAGGLTGALSKHAEEILDDLRRVHGDRIVGVTEIIFRALTSGSSVASAVRWPTPVNTLVDLAGGDRAAVHAVLEAFRAPDRNFLLPDETVPLDGDLKIDISHESLIRQWSRLRDWVETEAQAAAWWRRLVEAANRRVTDEGDWLRGRDLDLSLQGRSVYKPSVSWARRYGGDYGATLGFLDNSLAARRRKIASYAGAVVLACSVVSVAAYWAWDMLANKQQMEAAQRETALESFGDMASIVEISQNSGSWGIAGQQLRAVLKMFVVPATGELALKGLDGELSAKLDRLIELQHSSYGSGQQTSMDALTGRIDVSPALVSALGMGDTGNPAIAIANDRQVTIARSSGQSPWQSPTAIDFAGAPRMANSRGGPPIAIALFDAGRGVVVVFRDKVLIARLEDQGLVWQAREIVAGLPSDFDPAVGRLVACTKDGTRVVLRAGRRFFWLDAVARNGGWLPNGASTNDTAGLQPVRWQQVMKGQDFGSWTFDPERELLAAIDARGSRIFATKCDSLDSGAPIKTPLDGNIRDIEFVGGGELGVLSRDKKAVYVQLDDKPSSASRTGESAKLVPASEVVALPSNAEYAQFATRRQIWVVVGKSLYQLWNSQNKQAQGIVLLKDGMQKNYNYGGMPVLFSASAKGLIVHNASPAAFDRTAMALAILLRVERDDNYQKVEAGTKVTHKLLLASKLSPPAALGRLSTVRCETLLPRLVAAADPNTMQISAEKRSVREAAGKLRDHCATSGQPASAVAAFRDWLIDAPEGNSSEEQTMVAFAKTTAAAAAGNPHALALLSKMLDTEPAAAEALAELSIRSGAPLGAPDTGSALSGVPRLLGEYQVAKWPREIMLQRDHSPYGTDHEQLAVHLAREGVPLEAAYHAAVAMHLHEAVDDYEALRRASRLLALVLQQQMNANDLATVWKQAWAFKPQPVASSIGPVPTSSAPTSSPSMLQAIDDLRSIARRTQTPLGPAAVLRVAGLAAAELLENPPADVVRGIYDEINRMAEQAPASVKADIGEYVYGMADLLKTLGADIRAAEAPIRALELADGDDTPVYRHAKWIGDALRDALAAYPDGPVQLKGRIRALRFRFLIPDDEELSDSRAERRDLTDVGASLLDLITKDVPQSPSMLAARGGISLWHASTTIDGRRKWLTEAADLFEQARAQGVDDVTTRLAHAQTLVRLAALPEEATYEAFRLRLDILTRARTLLRTVLDQGTEGKVGFVVASLLDADSNLARAVASLTFYELAKGDEKSAAEVAWRGIVATHEEEALLAKYSEVAAVKARRTGAKYTFDRMDAAIVGILAGSKRRAAPGERTCEALADQPWDPRRATLGVPSWSLDGGAVRAAIEVCEAEYHANPSPRLALALGSLYSFDPGRVQETVEKFIEAIAGDEPYAYRGLSNTLRASGCSLSEPLMDRYRYLTLSGHWKAAEPLLRRVAAVGDPGPLQSIIANAQTPPSSAVKVPSGMALDLSYIRASCVRSIAQR
jgi:hypothetical protein